MPSEPHAAKFDIPGRLTFEPGSGGLTRAVLKTPRSQAHVYLHGAHVTHFARSGEPPALFLSSQSLFQPDKAIRGGIPLIFPWFGPRQNDPVGNSPMHGFARLSEWSVESADATGDVTKLVLTLSPNDISRNLWPQDFLLRYTVTLSDALTMQLTVQNTGRQPFTYEEALHTYFAVSDVRNIHVEGLENTPYIDKADNLAQKIQQGPVKIAAETDRIYLPTAATCAISDPGHRRRILVEKQNSNATVVWNPWVAKAKAMADFGDDEWPQMLCIETCNVAAKAVRLQPDESHSMRAAISTRPL